MDFFCLRYGLIMDPFVQPHRAVKLTIKKYIIIIIIMQLYCTMKFNREYDNKL